MSILIFEHVCGGGMVEQALPEELMVQGLAMFTAVIEDFQALGVEVLTTCDHRLSLSGDHVRPAPIRSAAELAGTFDTLALHADAALVIAPEFEGLAAGWCRRLRMLGVRSLGSAPEAVELCADKLDFSVHLRQSGVATPPTCPASVPYACEGPVICKPRRGAGCERTYVYNAGRVVRRGLHGETGLWPPSFIEPSSADDWIVQPYVAGLAASCSWLVHEAVMWPLPAGQQLIAIETCDGSAGQLHYRGGCLPLPTSLLSRATELSRRAVRSIPGLQGFVGVDLVLADDPARDVVVEINPRLTMSYVGLRRLCRENLAAALLDPSADLTWLERPLKFDASGRVRWDD